MDKHPFLVSVIVLAAIGALIWWIGPPIPRGSATSPRCPGFQLIVDDNCKTDSDTR
jgi:hypothetical protein